MREIFKKGMEAGLSFPEIDAWINHPTFDPRTWTLKPGAPKNIVDIFPDYIDFSLNTGQGEKDHADEQIDYSDASTLFVYVWQLARDARRLVDLGVTSNVNRDYVSKLDEQVKALEELRDHIHDSLLSEEDRANGAVPRLESSQ
jgi:hypothetical protein